MTSFLEYTTALQAKLAFLALSITLLISSCSDPALVGIELAPGNNQIGVFYQEFTFDAQLVLLDSFNTTNSGVLVVGNESDDYFGKTDATGYSRLYIDATKTKPGAEAVLDSMFFNMAVVSVNGSDLDKPKMYSVHKLTESIQDTLYYNFDKLAFGENPFAEIEITFDDVKDTVMRLSVDAEFQEELFGKMQLGTEFNNLFNFRSYFPGIAVKAREGDNTTVGVALGANTGIAVYYHNAGDTIPLRYDINTVSSRSFNGIESDRSGTPTAVVTEYGVAYDAGSIVGMKSTMGMALRIDTSPLDPFLDTLSGVTFNQVSFSMGEIESQDEDNHPISRMVMIFVDQYNDPIRSTIDKSALYVQADGQAQVVVDANGDKLPTSNYRTSAVLEYDSKDELYQVALTSHVNAIYRRDIQRQNWLLYSSTPPSPSNPAGSDDFKRSLRQFKVNKDKIKMKVIYSKSR